MYVRDASLGRLADFLRGYHLALAQHKVPGDHSVLSGFQVFVAQRYSVKISQSWDNIILFQAAHNNEALEMFWELLDEYLAQQGISLDCEYRPPV
jgi:hypothetical protein